MGLAHFRYGFTICCVRNNARRESPSATESHTTQAPAEPSRRATTGVFRTAGRFVAPSKVVASHS